MRKCLALASLLLAQATVAAHVCPSLMIADSGCMGNMDTAPSDLCKAHNEVGFKLVDNYSAPSLPAAPASTLLPWPASTDVENTVRVHQRHGYYLSRVARDGAPPVFLRHQVLRT